MFSHERHPHLSSLAEHLKLPARPTCTPFEVTNQHHPTNIKRVATPIGSLSYPDPGHSLTVNNIGEQWSLRLMHRAQSCTGVVPLKWLRSKHSPWYLSTSRDESSGNPAAPNWLHQGKVFSFYARRDVRSWKETTTPSQASNKSRLKRWRMNVKEEAKKGSTGDRGRVPRLLLIGFCSSFSEWWLSHRASSDLQARKIVIYSFSD